MMLIKEIFFHHHVMALAPGASDSLDNHVYL